MGANEIFQYLESFKSDRELGLMWDYTSKCLWISTVGYIMQDHMNIEQHLLTLGLRYDLDHEPSKFDKTNGRTTTYFKLGSTKSR